MVNGAFTLEMNHRIRMYRLPIDRGRSWTNKSRKCALLSISLSRVSKIQGGRSLMPRELLDCIYVVKRVVQVSLPELWDKFLENYRFEPMKDFLGNGPRGWSSHEYAPESLIELSVKLEIVYEIMAQRQPENS